MSLNYQKNVIITVKACEYRLQLCGGKREMTWSELSTELKSTALKLSFDVGFKHD